MTLSEPLRAYLRLVAAVFVDDHEDPVASAVAWNTLTEIEREWANDLIDAIFGPWL